MLFYLLFFFFKSFLCTSIHRNVEVQENGKDTNDTNIAPKETKKVISMINDNNIDANILVFLAEICSFVLFVNSFFVNKVYMNV